MIGYHIDLDIDQTTEFFNNLRTNRAAFKSFKSLRMDIRFGYHIMINPDYDYDIDGLIKKYYTNGSFSGYIEFECESDAVAFKLKYM